MKSSLSANIFYVVSNIKKLFANNENTKIIFLGPQPQKAIYYILRNCHVLCVPSILEAQGLANIEGMAHGAFVVTSSAGGIPEVLDFGKNGWLCTPGDAVSLAEKLESCIMESNTEKERIVNRARKFAEEKFDHMVVMKNLISILEKQLKKV